MEEIYQDRFAPGRLAAACSRQDRLVVSAAQMALTLGYDAVSVTPMSEPLSSDDARLLTGLCRAGKLYEIEKWIAAGKSLRTPPHIKRTPLQIALELGFHSLIELLVRNEDSQAVKNFALSEAVSRRKLELVELLVSYGADLRSVELVEVLLTWEPKMIRYFLDHGADVVTGAPFAIAFREKVRTALRPFVEYKKAHADAAPALQEQADRALRHFCYEGDLKWVSLLMWAGANPRTRGPDMDERWADDPDCHTTALLQACYNGSLDIVLRLKPDLQKDNLSELVSAAATPKSRAIMEYLLKLGAKPNDKTNGGSSGLDHCFWRLAWGSHDQLHQKRLSTRHDVAETLECVRELVEHGAVWKPDDRYEMNRARQALYQCEPVVTVDLMKLLAENKACPEETLEEFLGAPRMRQHLSTLGINVARERRSR